MAPARPHPTLLHSVTGAAAALLLTTLALSGSAPVDGHAGSAPVDGHAGGAVAADPAGWRELAGPVVPAPPRPPDRALLDQLAHQDVTVLAAVLGDADGDGADELVAVFLRDPRPTVLAGLGTVGVRDADGRTLHLGVYDLLEEPGSPVRLVQHWVAGTVLRPIASVAACDGSVLLGYADEVGGDTVAVGVVAWRGYGFAGSALLPDLPGTGTPACADVDGDHLLEPVVVGRSLP